MVFSFFVGKLVDLHPPPQQFSLASPLTVISNIQFLYFLFLFYMNIFSSAAKSGFKKGLDMSVLDWLKSFDVPDAIKLCRNEANTPAGIGAALFQMMDLLLVSFLTGLTVIIISSVKS